jgi:hypothetical protein
MKYREFTLTKNGKLISLFFQIIADDYHFNPNEPMTDTYIQEVCYEAGFNKEETLTLMDELVRMGIVD